MSGQSWYLSLGLGNIVTADFNPGPEEGLGKLVNVKTEQMGNLLGDGVVGKDGLIGVPLLLEDHVAEEHDTRDDLPDGVDVVLRDAHDLHGLHGLAELLGLILAADANVPIGQEGVVLGIFQNKTFCNKIGQIIRNSFCIQLR